MQIEKIKSPLDLEKGNYKGTEFDIIPADTFVMVCRKINELIDAVNILQVQVAILEEHAHPTAKTEPTDPYAEQRKWIGCLCRFWNFKDGAVDIGILKAVDNLIPAIPYISDIDCSYAYCEPVKPNDDIIYKGD